MQHGGAEHGGAEHGHAQHGGPEHGLAQHGHTKVLQSAGASDVVLRLMALRCSATAVPMLSRRIGV